MANTYRHREDYLRNKKLQSQRRRLRQREYIDSLTTPCLFCGSLNDIVFHHINANNKYRNITLMTSESRTRIKEEVDKCWCLCNDCHLKLHRRLLDPLPHLYDT